MKFSEIRKLEAIKLPADYTKLTQPQRAQVRKQYIILQEGKCWFCKEPLEEIPSETVRKAKLNLNLFPSGFLRFPIHLHHDHKTNMTIGAVHSECNGYLWQYLGE